MDLTIPTLITGSECTVLIDCYKNLHSFGFNQSGKLGHDKEETIISSIKEIPSLYNIKMVGCGRNHTVCCDFDGTLYSFGDNTDGQLGIGNNKITSTHIPQQVNIPPIDRVETGHFFVICLSFDNQIYSFGSNSRGQLGNNSFKSSFIPIKVPNFNNVDYIACGDCHSVCRTLENKFYTWGDGRYGILGLGDSEMRNVPTYCKNWPKDIISVKMGIYHSLILTNDGKIYTCGCDTYGTLGLNSNNTEVTIPTLVEGMPPIKKIETGYLQSFCLDYDNNMYVFGWNGHGSLGLGDTQTRNKPILMSSFGKILDISHGGYHTFFKNMDNEIYVAGYNTKTQTGIKTQDNKDLIQPTRILNDKEILWSSVHGKSRQKSARK